MSIETVQIGDRSVGRGNPVLIVAEIGIAHGGDVQVAAEMLDAAADAGADAVKFQTVDPDSSYVPGTKSYEVFSGRALTLEEYKALLEQAKARNLLMLTTPGDLPSLELATDLRLPALKISSGLMTNRPLLEAAARTPATLIISTGMAYLSEVARVVEFLAELGTPDAVILHCVSSYPAADDDLGLRVIPMMEAALSMPIGYSDHSPGSVAAVAAVALGACLVEKHFTLSHSHDTPDQEVAVDPEEFADFVVAIRRVESMLKKKGKRPTAEELRQRENLRRSLVASRKIAKGEALSRRNVGLLRTKDRPGLEPEFLELVIGGIARRDIEQHEPILWEAVEPTGEAGS